MSQIIVTFEGAFGVVGCTPDELHAIGERVMQELLKLEGGADGLMDSSTWTDSDEMTVGVEISAPFSEEEPVAAEIAIDSAVRTAFHAAGVGTPKWREREISRDEVSEEDLLLA